jgi:SAM-dependent methyltransferase
MSSNADLILEVIQPGTGFVLDLGGNQGTLRQPLQGLGYYYINLDICHFENSEPSVISDAHHLPFKDCVFDLVVSKDTMEHFLNPWVVAKEVHRALKNDGHFVIFVPFMHPFHGNDFFRFTPLGLQHLLEDFELLTFESPLWAFTVLSFPVIEILKRLNLGFLERRIKQMCGWLDRLFVRQCNGPASYASAYRVVARKRAGVER